MTKNKRSGSEVRQRTKVITLRVNNRIANEIRRRAKSEGLTISEYIRTTSLNNEIKQRVPSRYLDELIQLGRMQKKLFDKGKRPKDKEYLDVMHKIISLCAEMKEVTQRISDIYKKMDLIKEEIKAIKKYIKINTQVPTYLIEQNIGLHKNLKTYNRISDILFYRNLLQL